MYNHGWRGLNIDLNPLTIELFNYKRPKDKNLCVALSNKVKNSIIFSSRTGSQNTLSKSHVSWMRGNFGIKELKKKIVKTTTLKNVLKNQKLKKIDFLNIDIEGSEYEVISSINLKQLQIKVICIELEYNRDQKFKQKKILSYLMKNGYEIIETIRENYILKKVKKKN